MAQNSLIQVRVDENLKKEADHLFADLGLDTPTAIRIFLKQAIKQQGLPFDVNNRIPNAETIAAMEEVNAGQDLSGPYNTVDNLMSSLVEDDNV